jgi:hypothetical protein
MLERYRTGAEAYRLHLEAQRESGAMSADDYKNGLVEYRRLSEIYKQSLSLSGIGPADGHK